MQGILLFVFALIALNYGQPDAGGCCFYRKANFQDEIRCTSEPFTIAEVNKAIKGKESHHKDGIGSFFCTERFSAAILGAGARVEELVDCGDVVNETTSAIPTESVTVGECLQRRCCLYTGTNKDGIEYCVNTDEAPNDELPRVQQNETFLVAECLEEWQAVAHTRGGKVVTIGCGETADLEAGTIFTKVMTRPCGAARAVAESVDDGDFFVDDFAADQQVDQAVLDFDENNFAFEEQQVADQAVAEFSDDIPAEQFAEQAVVDSSISDVAFETAIADTVVDPVVDEFAVDQTVADQAVAEFAVDQNVADQAVAEFAVDQNVADQAVAEFAVDQNVADQAVAEFTVDQNVAEEFFADQAVMDDAAFADANIAVDQLDQALADYDDEFTHQKKKSRR